VTMGVPYSLPVGAGPLRSDVSRRTGRRYGVIGRRPTSLLNSMSRGRRNPRVGERASKPIS
jgi:hypothetical protein